MPKSTQRNLSVKKLLHLIELVEENPVLYDPSHPFNKDTSHKNSLWESIAEELDSRANVIKKEWNKLSSDFYARKSGKATEEALAFLSNHKETPSVSSLIENKENNSSAPGLSISELSGRELKSFPSDDLAPGPTPQNTPSDLTSISNTRVLRPRRSEPTGSSGMRKSSPGRKRTKGISENHLFADSSVDDDANHAFFESMALTVALFPRHLQASVKMKICDLVNDTEAQLSSPNTIS